MVRLKEIDQVIKEPVIKTEQQPRFISCQVVQDKLVSELSDGREIIVSVNLLTKWGILDKDVKPEQLKKLELQNEGRYLYFPKIDEILPVRIISEGLFKSCWEK